MVRSCLSADFILQALDPVTRTVALEWRVRISDVDRLREILDEHFEVGPHLNGIYDDIPADDMDKIGALCDPPVRPAGLFTQLQKPSPLYNNIPYFIHTNFELPLMLEGRKPLAVFAESYPSPWFDEYLAPFDPFVKEGRIVRQIVDTPMPHFKRVYPSFDGVRYVYFALPGEEWRIEAYRSIDAATPFEWERLQGSLLGYEDWQNDWWIEHRVKPGIRVSIEEPS